MHKLPPVLGIGVFDRVTFKEFKQHIRFIAIHPDVGALFVWNLGRARVVMCAEIRKRITLEQDRFSGTILIVAKYKRATGRPKDVVCLHSAALKRHRTGIGAQIILGEHSDKIRV